MFGWLPVTLWVLVGGIFFGGVHDFGALFASVRHNGQSIGEIISASMSKRAKQLFIIFSYLTLILVVAAFAAIVASTFGAVYENGVVNEAKSATQASVAMVSLLFIAVAIVFGFAVYRRHTGMVASTILGVGAIVLCMAIGMNFHPFYFSTHTWMWLIGLYITIASVTPVWILLQPRDYLSSFLLYAMLIVAIIGIVGAHPDINPDLFPAYTGFSVDNGNGTQYLFPILFTTVACGAISGFHSTQSPLMARCMKSEKQGHFVFYGAMVCEGVIALIWAAAGCSLYEVTGGLNTGLAEALAMGQSKAIYDVCSKTMGGVGIALAMIGVVVCPITSGDTAFRSARLTLADWFKIDQDSYANRLKLCVPVLGVGAFLGIGNALGFINYTVIWRYFSWTNQTLAMIDLRAASKYLFKEKKNYWLTAVPATFISAESSNYFILAPECLGSLLNSKTADVATIYNTVVAYPIGVIFAIAMLAIFIHATKKHTASQKA